MEPCVVGTGRSGPDRESVPKFKVDAKWNDRFVLITRSFITEFCLSMSRNAWILYVSISTFYNISQERAFPKLEMLEAVCPLSRWSRSRALLELLNLRLVEVWGEKVGRRRRTFYRLLQVNPKGWHMAERQQLTGEELQERFSRKKLLKGMEWVQKAYRKSKQGACLN